MVLLTRRVQFSSGHRYWLDGLAVPENKALYGDWASPYNHGHNYILDVTVGGEVDPQHGMVVNIKRLDDLLQDKVVKVFDQRSINDEVPHFRAVAPCLENLLTYFYETLFQSSPHAQIDHANVEVVDLRLQELPTLWANFTPKTQVMTVTRTYEFAASHRLHVPNLSDEENSDLFGKCNNPAGHGHNYILEITVHGQPNPETGMTVDLGALDKLVGERVVNRYDHKNLSVDLPEFEGKNATSEVVVEEIYHQLQTPIRDTLGAELTRVRLHETGRNIFEVAASQ